MGCPPSAIPSILNEGAYERFMIGDRTRQASWRASHPRRVMAGAEKESAKGYRPIIYVSRKKACSYGYPWVFGEEAGELLTADGSCPCRAILQGLRLTQDREGHPTSRWELHKKGNSQIATPREYVAWQWVHYYGVRLAFRPYRACCFSEAAFSPLPVAMCWDEKEWIRRLRKAERQVFPSDLCEGIGGGRVARLAPRRREPVMSGESQEAANQRQAERESVARQNDLDAGLPPPVAVSYTHQTQPTKRIV